MNVRFGAVAIGAVLVAATLGCGEQVDELGPYVEQLHQVDDFNARLVAYRGYLEADEQEKAATLSQTLQAYLEKLETFGQTDDKKIMAGHNALKRDLEHALNKIVEPDFPTFTISALKQIGLIEEGYKQHINNLERRWQEEGRSTPFTLAWPDGTT